MVSMTSVITSGVISVYIYPQCHERMSSKRISVLVTVFNYINGLFISYFFPPVIYKMGRG